ncbi:MAG: DUF1566 domain-containing protein [Bacteroidaceae bacterium]|nr:DUF1566 domain-containing protein [Bacteroidaceae bacterium]
MKKIILTLLALVGTMSMNAQKIQVMKIMKNGEVIAKYTTNQADKVVFVEELATTGTAKATIGGQEVDVNWVQLWEGGPKFAEYNVGVKNNKPEDYGRHHRWADNIASVEWGSNWRMPTNDEFDNLLANCTVEWTTVGGVNGCLFTGKGDYKDNSVFLPAAGKYDDVVRNQGENGYYWSSTANGSQDAYNLFFHSGSQDVNSTGRSSCYSVRAVLAE